MENAGGWIIVILLLLFGVWFFFLRGGVDYPSPEEANNLTNYLNQLGVTLYYSPTCHYCIEQEKYINFTMLENKINVLNISSPQIQGVPAWEYNGELIYGVQTNKQLEDKYGYVWKD